MIVKVSQFNTYTGNMEDSAAAIAMKENFLMSAEETVIASLGYDPVISDRSEYDSGIGQNRLYVKAHPISTVSNLIIDGTTIDSSKYTVFDTYIRLNNGVFPMGIENVKVQYRAGWSLSDMPAVITMAILNIAALKLAEANGNIGITGKSMGDNSRTFINYTNYDKWLKPLDTLRVVRFD